MIVHNLHTPSVIFAPFPVSLLASTCPVEGLAPALVVDPLLRMRRADSRRKFHKQPEEPNLEKYETIQLSDSEFRSTVTGFLFGNLI